MSNVKTDRLLRAAIGLLLAVLVFVISRSFHEKVVSVGDSAPSFTVTADNGKLVSTSNFGGKLLVLNFWATWCPPCIEEMPALSRFASQMSNSGVVVLGISVDKDEKAYKELLSRAQPSFLTVRDPEQKINTEYGTLKYPETYVIDTSGKVLRKFIGPEPWDDPRMVQDIRSLL